jgi:Tol biopolymer transport system component
VHFPRELEPIARRAAGSAERAYERLSPLLAPSRGRIDLAVTDHVDYSNGFAYVSPSPRMVIFARPPVDDRTLRFREDWLDLVVQHELVHVFQLDRTLGLWSAAQFVFGRQPMLFPNAWAPSWLLEGLAVHYESKLGDGGRIEGLAHAPYANALAFDNVLPRFGTWSMATLDFPGGNVAYVLGSLLVESMEGLGGAHSIERFVERASARPIPWMFEDVAQQEFGTTFAAQWVHFSDSLQRAVRAAPVAPVRIGLSPAMWYTRFPRLAPDGKILYVASNGRDVTGLYERAQTAGATPVRIARRNSLEPNVALRDGRVIFAQYDYTDPYRLRADLWVRDTDGSEHALTHGARLFAPDARWNDGAIVAAQNLAGTTRLVRVDASGAVTPITSTNLDTTWSAPRWSHDGTRIVATRWIRGGTMSIVVLDSTGRNARIVASARATIDDPSWTLDDASVLFSVNATGTASIWAVDVATGVLHPGVAGATSLDAPQALGADGLAAIETRGRGERLVTLAMPAASAGAKLPSIDDTHPSVPADTALGAVEPYRPLGQLMPRYWFPLFETTDENRTRYGALISGSDIVGRHAYVAALSHEFKRNENSGFVSYRYAGLGLPLIDLSALEEWDHTPLVDSARTPVGMLSRRRRFVGGALTYVHQRVRNAAVLSGGAEMEFRDFSTTPAALLGTFNSLLFLKTLKYPTFTIDAGWSNTRRPILSLGPEDGVSVSASARWRWRTDDPSATRSATYIATTNAFKAITFIPGPAHHVLALHGAIGIADERTNTQLEAGGVSGSAADVAPGLVAGDVQRTFFVRGFPAGAQAGIRAMSGSAEYRAPLAIPSWGSGFIPMFLQRVSATVFADAGKAWCPAGSAIGTLACPTGKTAEAWMTSVGGELALDAALLTYDVPYRLRVGYASPMPGTAFAKNSSGTVYFSLGASF